MCGSDLGTHSRICYRYVARCSCGTSKRGSRTVSESFACFGAIFSPTGLPYAALMWGEYVYSYCNYAMIDILRRFSLFWREQKVQYIASSAPLLWQMFTENWIRNFSRVMLSRSSNPWFKVCPRKTVIALTKHYDQTNLVRNRFIWLKPPHHLFIIEGRTQMGQKTGGRRCCWGYGGVLLTDLLIMASSAWFLIEPRSTSSQIASPTMGLALPHQLLIKKIISPTGLVPYRSYKGILLTEIHSF